MAAKARMIANCFTASHSDLSLAGITNGPIVLHCRAMKRSLLICAGALLLATGCDIPGRLSRLEKQTKEMQSERDRVTDYDLQAKCSKDAKTWFGENWSSDKDTMLLDYRNHYNKKQNKCFIFVEYHYKDQIVIPGEGSWTND